MAARYPDPGQPVVTPAGFHGTVLVVNEVYGLVWVDLGDRGAFAYTPQQLTVHNATEAGE
jgi:preprotein translocase subunit YajC